MRGAIGKIHFQQATTRGRMIPEKLEELVIKHKEQGHLPFFLNCTTGARHQTRPWSSYTVGRKSSCRREACSTEYFIQQSCAKRLSLLGTLIVIQKKYHRKNTPYIVIFLSMKRPLQLFFCNFSSLNALSMSMLLCVPSLIHSYLSVYTHSLSIMNLQRTSIDWYILQWYFGAVSPYWRVITTHLFILRINQWTLLCLCPRKWW